VAEAAVATSAALGAGLFFFVAAVRLAGRAGIVFFANHVAQPIANGVTDPQPLAPRPPFVQFVKFVAKGLNT
jgi:hypothetical protein